MDKALSVVEKYTNTNIDQNKGYYQIWANDPKASKKKQWRAVWGFTVQDYQTVEYDPTKLLIKSNNKVLKLDKDKNYYVTQNPMRTAKGSKESDQLRGLTRLVIDIDRNNNQIPEESYYNAANRLLWLIERDLVKTKEIPMYSKAVFSGRGLQLHYNLHQAAPFSYIVGLANMVSDKLINEIEALIESYEEPYSVDLAASRKHAGLIRLGGINQKSHETVIHKDYGHKYTLKELLSYFKISLEPQKKTRRANVSVKAIDLNNGRINRLEQIQALRIASNRYVGYRNKLVFLYFNSLVGLNQDNALSKVYQFNNKFPSPIPESEIKAMERYLNEVGHLKFRSETFYDEWLELTPEEEIEIKKKLNRVKNHSEAGIEARQKQKQKEKTKRKQKREYELQKRLNVLRDTNTTNKEKAKLLNVSISTIQRLKRKYKELL